MEVRGQPQLGGLDTSEANAAARVGSRHNRGKPRNWLAGACDHNLFTRLGLFQQGRELGLGLIYVYKHDSFRSRVGQIVSILTNSANLIFCVLVTGLDLAQVLRKHSASPADDLAALYRHMVFNAAIGNVDDHVKNFWMLARPGGFRLAPAFDLVPDISGRGEHTLSFQQGFVCPARAEMIARAP